MLMAPIKKFVSNKNILSVTQLVSKIKFKLEQDVGEIHVVGEISSLKQSQAGHSYFDLKDERSLIRCVMFRHARSLQKFSIKDGVEVVIKAKVSVYLSGGSMQLIVQNIEPMGAGALALAFEQLKEKLSHKGYFDSVHKKTLPFFPRKVGVVTSATGSVIHDIIKVATRRNPAVSIMLSPCQVQGEHAYIDIVAAIKNLQNRDDIDVIVVCRGGGSLEDLWPFNKEEVAEAIFHCEKPVISAVGHETDFTIADFVADLRCATPTHAAEIVSPVIDDIIDNLNITNKRLNKHIISKIQQCKLHLANIENKIKNPKELFYEASQSLDEISLVLNNNIKQFLINKQKELDLLKKQIEKYHPYNTISRYSKILAALAEEFSKNDPKALLVLSKAKLQQQHLALSQLIKTQLQAKAHNFYALGKQIDALSPLKVLKRGFCIAHKKDSLQIYNSVKDFYLNKEFIIDFIDGKVEANVVNIIPKNKRGE